MANSNDLSISNISYTNKDFQTIFPEVLDKAKSLSYKWDPTTSNESDPGVVLLKLDALIADKNNYNIDKNVLEYFPVSVTQESVARGLFEQLGYTMHWYKAATTNVTIKWSDITKTAELYIPRWTMVCDDDSTVVYTIIGNKISNTSTYPVMQGKCSKYEVNGETTILGDMLDSENRLYFDNYAVAENGIFINNIGSENWSNWKKVDNLGVQDYGTTCYKFGITEDGRRCYIEFPTEADAIIGSGIEIRYLVTDGLDGNIAPQVLTKFFQDKIEATVGSETQTISTEDVTITNGVAAINGANPETIDSAYRNYKRTVGTFDTLVSLTDYENKINTLGGYASNNFVCDRTNDVQDCYHVLTEKSGEYTRDLVVGTKKVETSVTLKEGTSGTLVTEEPLMDAFSLKIYALRYAETVNVNNFADTFSIVPNFAVSKSSDMTLLEKQLEETKCIQHDFQVLEENKILFLKNKFPITCKIIPQYSLTEMQQKDVISKVYDALAKGLNSKEVDFGAEADYDRIYSLITNADERIKAIVLDDISYETYAVVYYRNGADSPVIVEFKVADNNSTFVYGDEVGSDTSRRDFVDALRLEIQAKSILNGNTQLYVHIDDIGYAYNQSADSFIENATKITTNTTKTVKKGTPTTLLDNESIVFYAPNFVDRQVFSSYCKYVYSGADIQANGVRRLTNGEYVVIFNRASDTDNYSYTKLVGNTKFGATENKDGSIISPNFTLVNNTSGVPDFIGGLPNSGTLTAEQSEAVAKMGTAYSLGATKTITVKYKNVFTVKSDSQYCYWKLNQSVTRDGKQYYVMFDKDKYERILQSGEFFIVTDSLMAEFVAYGAGTKISRTHEGSTDIATWECIVSDTDGLQSEGATSITGWVKVNSGDTVSATEMQIVVATNTVTMDAVKQDSPSPETTVYFRNNGVYTTETGGTALKSLDGYTFSADGTKLPDISVVGDAWNAYSRLDFKCSQNTPMVLGSDSQEIVVTYALSVDTDVTETAVIVGGSNKKYILSDYSYDLIGGINISLERISDSGNTEKALIYAYTDTTQAARPTGVDFSQSGVVRLPFDGTTKSCSVKFKLPNGIYLIGFENPVVSESGTVSVASSSNKLFNVTDDISKTGVNSLSFTGTGRKYFLYKASATSVDTLTVTQTEDAPKITVSMWNPIKIDTNNIPSKALFDEISAIDVNKVFDYSYIVPEEDLVENPLLPKSFTEINHVYNRYTICQAVFKTDGISVVNKAR